MEWPNDKALLFINEIERLPILWDSSDPYYKISRKKNEAWESLANKFSTTVLDVKKKWLSLQASYRRERIKVIDSAKGSEKKVLSKWFAYRAMMFLGDHYRPRGARNTCETSEACQQEENSDHTHHEGVNQIEVTRPKVEAILHESDRSLRSCNSPLRKKHLKVFHSPELSSPKKKKINEDSKPSEMYILKATVAEKESQRDENETYGEYVALTLKKLDNYSRIMAKHYINEILIEAELGKYKDSIPQRSPTPTTTYSTISPSLSAFSYQSGGSNNVISSEPNL
ncbi:PREDICTED: transcription factor Adf-1-like [Vollenhovia emeryi]|uniref:transcription factor Adf-1-like n=1 Tax=Vollenhovia emeryi TaxID=411798 RepID=UPI0005F553D1|nr:PREDICTED: transcription factor Adf-1-like [Vollenhovia emeryi]